MGEGDEVSIRDFEFEGFVDYLAKLFYSDYIYSLGKWFGLEIGDISIFRK